MKLISLNILLILCLQSYAKEKRYEGIEHFNPRTNKFFNPDIPNYDKGLLDVLSWKIKHKAAKWPQWIENKTSPNLPAELKRNEMAITFINHSSFLIQIGNINILTDPIFSQRTSPVSWAGPKRVRPPGIDFSQLPKIDYVIISHNHYDHLDLNTLTKLEKKFSPLVFVPIGDGKLLKSQGITNVHELDWWQSKKDLKDNLKITFTPAQHFSGRGLFDRMESLWGSYVLSLNNLNLFFGGDTGYSKHFKEIKHRLGEMDFSLIPIGAYEPRWFMKAMHVNPDEAVQAHIDLKSKKSIGMHFGTFQLTDEAIDQPIIDLEAAKQKHSLKSDEFTVLDFGQTLNYSLDKNPKEL